jgi:8-oxo-dGTP diphosphatase
VITRATARGLRVITDRGASLAREVGAAGVHVRERELTSPAPSEQIGLRIASCHTHESLARAAHLGYDAAVVGPVLATATHPGQAALGWDGFAALVMGSNLPIYAIGGMSPHHLSNVWECRGRGVAAISAYWGRGGGSGSGSSSPSASTAGMA